MMSHMKSWCLSCVGILLMLSVVTPRGVTPGSGKERSYVSGSFMLTLDGKNQGFIKSVDGGAITAEVITEPAGPSYFTKKHIGQPRYEDFTVQAGFSMTKSFYEWIAASWTSKLDRRNGSFIAADQNLQAQSERKFFNALITETTIPAMDGSSKEPGYLTVRLASESIRVEKATGRVEGGLANANQKMFLPACFRMQIDGLDCTKISHIDSFTVKRPAVIDDVGDARDRARQPGKVVFPNIRVTVAESTAQSWLDWHESFVVQGRNDDKAERNGVLTLLSANQQTVLATIRFFNMGIFSIQNDKAEANADQIRRVTAELYVERMEFEAGGEGAQPGSTGTTPPPTTQPVPLRRG
ncbi:MAG TPA: phage tail protein [Sedimentisphaerales bacterium]|nr:phage tail protein [Sedimentisphaerales bacterium]